MSKMERYSSCHHYRWVSKATGQFLKEQRRNLNLSGEELAKKMHLSQQQISRYERGVTNASLPILLRFFSALNMDEQEMRYFFELIVSWSEDIKNVSVRD